MKWIILVFLVIIKTVLCVEITAENNGDSAEEIIREIREFDREGWRAIKASEGNNEWVPQDKPQEFKLVRRRLRKRKKRPPFISDDPITDEIGYMRPLRRRIRPHRIHEKHSPWDDIPEEDSVPYMRRRIPPRLPIDDTIEFADEPTSDEIKTRLSTANDEPAKQVQNQEQRNPIQNLKSILKQSSGTLSLSEILQQKNLSLTELLNGDEKAISALTEKPLATTEKITLKTKEDEIINGEVVGHEKTVDKIVEIDNNVPKSKKNQVDVNRKRVVSKRPIEQLVKVVRDHITVESTTERRIFVPSHPKYYTSLSFKPDFNQYLDNSPEKTTSTTQKPLLDNSISNTRFSTITGKLPTTNAKLKQNFKDTNKSKKQNITDMPKPIKINLNEVIGFQLMGQSSTTEAADTKNDNDKPLRIPIDIELMMENATFGDENDKTTTEIPLENTIYVTAREEIMEVLKDPSSREKLAKILEMRNMTIDELVQQRERGSSQVHLADIFHNQSKEPEPKEEVLVGHIDVGQFSSSNERQQKSRNFESEYTVKNQTVVQEVIGNKIDFPQNNSVQEVQTQKTEIQTESPDIQNFDAASDPLFSLVSNEKFNVDEVHTEDEVFIRLPSGVKSAIFVSLAIIGLSILVFLTILVIFKWTQLKHRRINYCNSLTSKFRAPIILQGRPTAAIKTFVNETLGRRKSYYKNNVQRMCDNIWEGDKDRKLSF